MTSPTNAECAPVGPDVVQVLIDGTAVGSSELTPTGRTETLPVDSSSDLVVPGSPTLHTMTVNVNRDYCTNPVHFTIESVSIDLLGVQRDDRQVADERAATTERCASGARPTPGQGLESWAACTAIALLEPNLPPLQSLAQRRLSGRVRLNPARSEADWRPTGAR